MTDSNSIGKWFEDELTLAFKAIQSGNQAMFHRFPDTRAARNPLPAQPADFLFAIEGRAFLVEAKCSETYASLRNGFSALWPKHEAAFHRKWHRAGCASWVIFCDYRTDQVELWSGSKIAQYRAAGKAIPKTVTPDATGHLTNLSDLLIQVARAS